jgi:nucleoid-associated protein YgaU
MTRQTRIGLLVALAFIIMFGLVLGELSETANPTPAPTAMEDISIYAHTSAVEAIPVETIEESYSRETNWPAGPEVVGVIDVDRTLAARTPDREPAAARPAAGRAVTERPAESAQVVPPSTVHAAAAPPSRPAAAGPAAPARPAPVATRTHKVQSGDNLTRIARKYYGPEHETKYKRIFQANRDKMADESTLQVGMVLVIPPMNAVASIPAPAPEPRRAALAPHGRIASEPERAALAPRGRLAIAPLPRDEMTLAELDAHFKKPTAGRVASGRVYVVRRGDSLTTIARKVLNDGSRASVLKLYDANRDRLQSPDHLAVGMTLRIPA